MKKPLIALLVIILLTLTGLYFSGNLGDLRGRFTTKLKPTSNSMEAEETREFKPTTSGMESEETRE